MAVTKILIGQIQSIDSQMPGQQLAATGGALAPAATNVTLQGGAACHVDPNLPNAAHHVRMLQMLHHARMPAYLETDPNTNAVTRLLIPRILGVEDIASAPNGNRLEVRFRGSHAIHFLNTQNPEYQSLLGSLKDAHKRGVGVYIVDEPDRPEIIHVSPTTAPLTLGATAVAPAAPAPTVTRPLTLAAISFGQAQAMFDLVNAQTCPTNASSPSCIPFLYPDDGCWARAHEMCRLMILNGADPSKVWLYGNLHVNTNHSPVCGVNWGWHVAPILQLDTGDQCVIDPSLFARPAALPDWIAIQNTSTPPSTTEFTDATVYRTSRLTGGTPEYDPGYSQTAVDLNTYRMYFANRCAVENPPGPPYSCP